MIIRFYPSTDDFFIYQSEERDMKLYEAAFPYAEDILALPTEDLDQAATWYGAAFGLVFPPAD